MRWIKIHSKQIHAFRVSQSVFIYHATATLSRYHSPIVVSESNEMVFANIKLHHGLIVNFLTASICIHDRNVIKEPIQMKEFAHITVSLEMLFFPTVSSSHHQMYSHTKKKIVYIAKKGINEIMGFLVWLWAWIQIAVGKVYQVVCF